MTSRSSASSTKPSAGPCPRAGLEEGGDRCAVKCLMIMSLLLVSIGCKGRAPDPLDVSYRRLRQVPRDKWDKLAAKEDLFRASIGRPQHPRGTREGPEDRSRDPASRSRRPPIPGTSGVRSSPIADRAEQGPPGKDRAFSERSSKAASGQAADVAFFKFCYVDMDRVDRDRGSHRSL
ncbi:MAG: hypothetical protein MZU79_06035 [Anaerotruncus sp.]|nr:hypothetical protein [Anaerotruncus sp.]